MAFIEFNNVGKKYQMGDNTIYANKNLNFTIDEGSFCVIVGPSGAGKTTLLNLLGGMDTKDEGEILVDQKNVGIMKEAELTNYRRLDVGFIFQFYNLMPNLTALENVEISSELSKNPMNSKEVLELVGLGHRLNNFPSQLSGGEQQRVSIARAIAKNPKILLCDEPTGALDYETGKSILKVLWEISRNNKKTVIVITHNSALTAMADKVLYLKNGTIMKEEINLNPLPIESIEW